MGGLFKTKAPDPTPVQRMPDTEDPTVIEARRKAAVASQQRSGRTSTVLSSPATRTAATPNAGTTSYGNSLLGQSN
jgi:hypothetical protein